MVTRPCEHPSLLSHWPRRHAISSTVCGPPDGAPVWVASSAIPRPGMSSRRVAWPPPSDVGTANARRTAPGSSVLAAGVAPTTRPSERTGNERARAFRVVRRPTRHPRCRASTMCSVAPVSVVTACAASCPVPSSDNRAIAPPPGRSAVRGRAGATQPSGNPGCV